jgi:hypothetical protein
MAYLADKARRYPVNDTTVGDGLNTGGFRFNAKTPTSLNTYIARLDFKLTNTQDLFVRANYQSDNITIVPKFPDTATPTNWVHPKGIAAGQPGQFRPRCSTRRATATRLRSAGPGFSRKRNRVQVHF